MSAERINKILDKISESGMNSLLTIEKLYLDKCSKKENIDFLDKFLSNDTGTKIFYTIDNIDFEYEFADTEIEKTDIKHLGILRFNEYEFYGYLVVDYSGDYILPEFYDKNGNSLIDDFSFGQEDVNRIENFLIEVSINLSQEIDEE